MSKTQTCTINTEHFLFAQRCHYIVKVLQKKLLRTYFLVVVRLPFTMRVEVETDLKLPIPPPPRLSIPSRPPKEDEKEVNSTKREKNDLEKMKSELNPLHKFVYFSESKCTVVWWPPNRMLKQLPVDQ